IHDRLAQSSIQVSVIPHPAIARSARGPPQLPSQSFQIQAKPALRWHASALLRQEAQRTQPTACGVLLPTRQACFATPFGRGLPKPAIAIRVLPQHGSRPIETLAQQQRRGDARTQIGEAWIERNATPSEECEHVLHLSALLEPIVVGQPRGHSRSPHCASAWVRNWSNKAAWLIRNCNGAGGGP